MTLSARQAVAADLPAMRAITVAAYQPYVAAFGGEPPPMSEDYSACVAAGGAWLVMRDGADVGLAVLEAAADHLVILNLAVPPAAQGGGVGRWMLAFAESEARRLGVAEVRLFTNALMVRNIGIYRKHGYVETGRRPNPKRAGWTLVDMAKLLS